MTSTMSGRRILAVALPALGALAADPILSLVDTLFVGRLGTVPLAALGVDTAIFSFAFALFNFLAYATTPLVSQARGRGDPAESGRIVNQALTLAVVIGVTSMTVLAIGSPLFVRMMQAGPEVVDPAVTYLMIRSVAVPALLIITAGHGAYRGFEDTRTPLVVTIGVNLLNAVLDPLLIFGAGLGVAGAAGATVIAQWVGAGVFLTLLRRKGRAEGWERGRVRASELVGFLRIGGVLVMRTLLLVSSLALATAAAARIGTEEVAAHQIVSQVWFLLAMIVDALAIAAQTLVAGRIGAGDAVGARTLADRLVRWGVVVGLALAVGLGAGRGLIAPPFTDSAEVRDTVRSVMPIAAGMQPAAAVLFVLDGAFLALLAVRRLVASTAAGFVAIALVLAATLRFGWGLGGVWWAMTAMVLARLAVLGFGYVPAFSRS